MDVEAQVELPYPTTEVAERTYDDQDFHRAVEAYRFFYPVVSMEGIFNGNRELGLRDGKEAMVVSAGPRHLIFTANSDTPYCGAVLDLQEMGPFVVELPPGPYLGLVNDHHHRWIMDLGVPGPDAGKGGKHLILPPGFKGEIPTGHRVGRSPTYRCLLALRALPQEAGLVGAQQALSRVKVYPLNHPEAAVRFVDVTERTLDGTLLRWEGNLEFWKRLHSVIDSEPALDEYRPLYGVLAALGIEKGQPFAPDARVRRILENAAKFALEQMRVEGFANARTDCLVWKDRRWEWVALVPDSADFETAYFLDLQARDRWFIQAIAVSPAMFRRKVGNGSLYFLTARDENGHYLDGGSSYQLSVPYPVPASLFWSVTAYDARTRSQIQSPQGKAVLSSLLETFQPTAEETVELWFGPQPPSTKSAPWIQTTPKTGFFLYFRIYGPQAASLNGLWKLNDLVRL
jgi:hypothetical protein